MVPDTLHPLLADRISELDSYRLVSFLSYRSNRKFSELLLARRPDILERLHQFFIPIKDDTDASLVATLHDQALLSEDIRLNFVREVTRAATEHADASFLDDSTLENVLTEEEKDRILSAVEVKVLGRIQHHVERLRYDLEKDSSPEEYFEYFQRSLELFVNALSSRLCGFYAA
jgi:hypothetical protein